MKSSNPGLDESMLQSSNFSHIFTLGTCHTGLVLGASSHQEAKTVSEERRGRSASHGFGTSPGTISTAGHCSCRNFGATFHFQSLHQLGGPSHFHWLLTVPKGGGGQSSDSFFPGQFV